MNITYLATMLPRAVKIAPTGSHDVDDRLSRLRGWEAGRDVKATWG